MFKIKKFSFFSVFLLLTGCAEVLSTIEGLEIPIPISENEVANGLKDALKVGTDISVSKLSQQNGFFEDEILRILLPFL